MVEFQKAVPPIFMNSFNNKLCFVARVKLGNHKYKFLWVEGQLLGINSPRGSFCTHTEKNQSKLKDCNNGVHIVRHSVRSNKRKRKGEKVQREKKKEKKILEELIA